MKRLAAVTLVLAAVGVLAGCGGDDSGTSGDQPAQNAPAAAPQGGPPEGIEDLQACLEKHGVDLPDPERGGVPPAGGAPTEDTRKAFEACQDELPEGLGPPSGGGGAPPELGAGTPGTQS
jgi:hypothetical protein